MSWNRRDFLKFLGRSVAVSTAVQLNFWPSFAQEKFITSPGLRPILPSDEDRLILTDGFQYDVLIGWKDKINSRESFGYNNDFIGFIPDGKTQAYLWVNHESPHPLFLHEGQIKNKTKAQIIVEQKSVGGSLLKLKKQKDKWSVIQNHTTNRRYDGTTPIAFSSKVKISGTDKSIGTFANCGGGVTPWGSFLSCEENYDQYYGESVKGQRIETACLYDWQKHFQRPPEHYGWVTEINPKNGHAKKLVSLGRFAHEAALVIPLPDGRVVVYMGDDANDQFIYKFISSKPNSLDEGELFVANTEKGQWLSLNYEKNEKLKKEFSSQTEALIRTREAAALVGGTPQDRPEDMDRDPLTGAIIIAVTNNKPKNRPHGQLIKIIEKDNNPESLNFKASVFLNGGDEFSCPDNLTFDRNGNLWMAVDIAGTEMNKGHYTKFKNNGLFVIPARGPQAGKPLQVASSPKDAEFTGPCFSEDQKTLFLSVQHPGETSTDYHQPTSHWPDGKGKTPRPCVVTITGPALQQLTNPA